MARINIPESLQFYYGSAGNAAAIEALVEKINGRDNGATEDMDWNDLATYHRALLAGYQTQIDFWSFLKELWEAVWAPATAQLQELGATAVEPHKYEGELSLTHVWSHGIYRIQDIDGAWFVSAIDTDQKSINISFYYGSKDADYELSNGLKLNNDVWKLDAEDCNWTSIGRVNAPVRGKNTADVAMLQDAAHEAVQACKLALRS